MATQFGYKSLGFGSGGGPPPYEITYLVVGGGGASGNNNGGGGGVGGMINQTAEINLGTTNTETVGAGAS